MERLVSRFGDPQEKRDDSEVYAAFWLVETRILLLHAHGKASGEAAEWAASLQTQTAERAIAEHGRRMYVAWSFAGLSYEPKAGARFVKWLHDSREKLLRTTCYTDNRLIRMTGMAANLTFNNTATFPADEDEFHAKLDDWLERIHRRH